jgi:flagellar basal-body rod protein FlgG
MQAQQTNMDVIANNLANVNNSGFKKSRPDFQDILYQTSRAAGSGGDGSEVPTGIQVGLGSRVASVTKVFTTGDFQQTQNELDVAIEGSGFFQVSLPDGSEAYTRSGALKQNSSGTLVTSDGYSIIPEITIPENSTSLSISSDGTVSVQLDGENELTEIGSFELARFGNPSGLSSLGRNLYAETTTSGTPQIGTPGEEGYGTLSQGYLEGSNVNIMEEMVNMIAGQRAYEVNSKAITTADEMLEQTTQLVR